MIYKIPEPLEDRLLSKWVTTKAWGDIAESKNEINYKAGMRLNFVIMYFL